MRQFYNVWLSIEEVDEARDYYEDIDLPIKLGVFPNRTTAMAFVDRLLNYAPDGGNDAP